jgi:glycosyltransferase involved in cell wall biosynthesis
MRDSMVNICVGICTYRRCDSLERLLEKLRFQFTNNLFNYSVLVVDNDAGFSAEKILKRKYGNNFQLSYYNEKEKNIAKARNKVLELSKGDYLALIDDDEYPDDFWLYNHYSTCKKYNADGSLGPVISKFPEKSPKWILKSDVCNRKSFETGFIIKPQHARTGNCLLKKDKIDKIKCTFDVEFGLTGGEDVDFFYRLTNITDFKIVWCHEAVVFEPVTESRLNRKFYIQRAINRGENNQRFLNKNRNKIYSLYILLISFCKMLFLLIISPVLIFSVEKIRMRIIESFFHHMGRIQFVIKKGKYSHSIYTLM